MSGVDDGQTIKILRAGQSRSRAGTASQLFFVPYHQKVGANFKGGAMETSFDATYLQCTEVPGEGLQNKYLCPSSKR